MKFFFSLIIKCILILRGAQIGKNFTCQNFPKLILVNQKKIKLVVGNNVTISGKIELKFRNNSKIIINDNQKIDHGVRIIVANSSNFTLGKNSKVMMNSNINCGADITIGHFTGISANCFVTSSSHTFVENKNYMETEYEHKPISIGNNVQIGAFCFISPVSKIEDNIIVSPLRYTYGNLKSNFIYKGNPAIKIAKVY